MKIFTLMRRVPTRGVRAYSRESYDLNCAYISRITDWTFVSGDRAIATYSALDNHLLVTDLASGQILLSTKTPLAHSIVEGITQTKDGLLALLSLDKETQSKYTVSVIPSFDKQPEDILTDLSIKEGES